MPKFFFERSETFRGFFQAASSCWPLLKAEIELLPQAKDAVPCLRGWFDAPLPVPLRTVGELQFIHGARGGHTPPLSVTLVHEALGVWRHEFTSVLAPPPWTGADLVKAVAVENLEELKEFLVVGLGDTPAARFNAEGGLCSSFFTDH
jgi:hypothetical protein